MRPGTRGGNTDSSWSGCAFFDPSIRGDRATGLRRTLATFAARCISRCITMLVGALIDMLIAKLIDGCDLLFGRAELISSQSHREAPSIAAHYFAHRDEAERDPPMQ